MRANGVPLRRLIPWIAGGLLGTLVALSLILVAGSRRTARVAEYRAALSRLADEVVRLNDPLPAAFAAGVVPDPELVAETGEQLSAAKAALDALGPPPDELAEAHAALVEAMAHFQRAYARLAANLATGSATPFDTEFLTSATHGGEEIHRAARELDVLLPTDPCAGMGRLLPACWMWR